MGELFHALGIDWRLLLASIVNFFILFVILRKFVYRPVVRMLEKREQLVEDTVKRSERVQAEEHRLKARTAEELKGARIEAARIVERAAEHAEALKAQVVRDAHAEMAQMIADAKQELAVAKASLHATVRDEVADLVTAAAGKVIIQKLSGPADRRLVDAAVTRAARELAE